MLEIIFSSSITELFSFDIFFENESMISYVALSYGSLGFASSRLFIKFPLVILLDNFLIFLADDISLTTKATQIIYMIVDITKVLLDKKSKIFLLLKMEEKLSFLKELKLTNKLKIFL